MVEKFQPLDVPGLSQWIQDGVKAGKLEVAHPDIASGNLSPASRQPFSDCVAAHMPAPGPEVQLATIESAVKQFVAYELTRAYTIPIIDSTCRSPSD